MHGTPARHEVTCARSTKPAQTPYQRRFSARVTTLDHEVKESAEKSLPPGEFTGFGGRAAGGSCRLCQSYGVGGGGVGTGVFGVMMPDVVTAAPLLDTVIAAGSAWKMPMNPPKELLRSMDPAPGAGA